MSKHEVGDRLIEDPGSKMGMPYSAGRIAGMYDDPSKPGTVYMLLVSDSGAFTVYAALEHQHSRPWVPREIPQSVFKRMAETCLGGVDLPPEREPPKKKAPVETVRENGVPAGDAQEDRAGRPGGGEDDGEAADGAALVPGIDIWVAP